MTIMQAIAIHNGKGGVYKSTISSNLSGLLALGGWKVLLVDTDQQGHAALDLGVREATDDGASLAAVLQNPGATLQVVRDVRPGLDLVAGGPHLADVPQILGARMAGGRYDEAIRAFEHAIGGLAAEYNVVIIDTPPAGGALLQSVLASTRWILIPTLFDNGSIEGIELVAQNVAQILQVNPQVAVLGVVLAGIQRGATRIESNARKAIHDLVDGLGIPVFNASIGTAQAIAADGRQRGILVHEYETDSDATSTAKASLAADFQDLAREVAARITGAGVQA